MQEGFKSVPRSGAAAAAAAVSGKLNTPGWQENRAGEWHSLAICTSRLLAQAEIEPTSCRHAIPNTNHPASTGRR